MAEAAHFLADAGGGAVARTFFGRAMESGRIAHSYLFVGPTGSGKRLFARRLIKALLCERGGCETCSSCVSFEHDNHPSVHEYGVPEGKNQVDIDTVRALCARTHFRRETLQVALLKDADRLNEPAANALLKTLEEPPQKVLLFLLARSTAALPSTIVSRCHRVPFLGPDVTPCPFSPEQLAQLGAVFESSFFAELTPRAWLAAVVPETQGVKPALRELLEALLTWGRLQLGSLFGVALDGALRFVDRLLELVLDLERNVQADLVLEEVIRTLREARRVPFLQGLRDSAS